MTLFTKKNIRPFVLALLLASAGIGALSTASPACTQAHGHDEKEAPHESHADEKEKDHKDHKDHNDDHADGEAHKEGDEKEGKASTAPQSTDGEKNETVK